MRRFRRIAAAGLLALAGCATPIGLERLSPRKAYVELHRNALNSGRYSDESEKVLHRYDLVKPFKKDPGSVLKRLHEKALADDRQDLLYALSELSYRNADRLRRSLLRSRRRQARDYYFAAAIYAYFYIFRLEAPPRTLDQRLNTMADLYNRGLALGLMTYGSKAAKLELVEGPRPTPFGPVRMRLDAPDFTGENERIEGFYSTDEFRVRGLKPRNRDSGLGAPLTAVSRKLGVVGGRRSPATVFMRLTGDIRAWSAGQLQAALEVHDAYESREFVVQGRRVPMQTDTTVPIAAALSSRAVWKLGPRQFFSALKKETYGIRVIQPYRPGRIPVVFVHGTASSPIYWAEMWNTLRADRVLRERYQVWTFSYATANPITMSAALLRDGLTSTVEALDPEGKDPALRKMVVIGHSQGGLLAKLTATDTGDKIWRIVSDKSIDEFDADPKTRELLRRNLFFTPLPIVKRVIFLATPHRGSYRNSNFIQKIMRKFITLPGELADSYKNLMSYKEQLKLPASFRRGVPSSLQGMSTKNPFMLALADIPVAPGIAANSIIAVKGGKKPPEGNDGVVQYKSAHLAYAESELVVRSAHSCQSNPFAIEEIRRILLEHLKQK